MNRTLTSLHEEFLEMTLTVPLNRFLVRILKMCKAIRIFARRNGKVYWTFTSNKWGDGVKWIFLLQHNIEEKGRNGILIIRGFWSSRSTADGFLTESESSTIYLNTFFYFI